MRVKLALVALLLCLGTSVMLTIDTAPRAYLGAGLFGLGIGGLLTLLPIAWADYFGRRSYGAIRGLALSLQVLAQAAGPLLSGVLRDATGNYVLSLMCFVVLSGLAMLAGLAARRP
jgi:cyanate permease